MEKFIEWIATINDAVNSAVWGLPGLFLLIGTGILLTLGTKVFQVTHVGHWWKNTIATIFKKNNKSTHNSDKKSISQSCEDLPVAVLMIHRASIMEAVYHNS